MKKLHLMLALVFLGLLSCQKEFVEKKGQVTFSIATVDNQLKSSLQCGDPYVVIITIKDKSNREIYCKESIQLFNMNGYFISSPVSLEEGDYELSDFFIMDSTFAIIYAAPKINSTLAHLSKNPLGLKFKISKDVVTKLSPDVICSSQAKPEDFGYTTFNFNILKTFDFLLGVFVYNDSTKNYKLTDAELTIKADGTPFLTKSLGNITNQITLLDSYTEYEIIVTKPTYKTFIQKYTSAELKTYFLSSQDGPLVIKLEKTSFPVLGLVAHYPFNGNANDESGNGNNGTTNGTILTKDRFGNLTAAYEFNGINNYISFPVAPLIALKEYTYSMWVKPAAYPNPTPLDGMFVLSVGSTSSNQNQAFTYRPDGTFFGGCYNVSVTPNASYTQTNSYQPTQWIHVVLIRDASNIRFYVNGILSSNISSYSPNTNNMDPSYGSSPQNALIGARSNFQSSVYFKGDIDDLFIYNRALTSDEVTQLYNSK